jgi:hypothetical protein
MAICVGRVDGGGGDVPEPGDQAPRWRLALAGMTPDAATLDYSLAEGADVSLAVFDVTGRRVATLREGLDAAGSHKVVWATAGVQRGIYYCRMVAGGHSLTRSVLVLK